MFLLLLLSFVDSLHHPNEIKVSNKRIELMKHEPNKHDILRHDMHRYDIVNSNNVIYYIDLTIGTPPQKHRL